MAGLTGTRHLKKGLQTRAGAKARSPWRRPVSFALGVCTAGVGAGGAGSRVGTQRASVRGTEVEGLVPTSGTRVQVQGRGPARQSLAPMASSNTSGNHGRVCPQGSAGHGLPSQNHSEVPAGPEGGAGGAECQPLHVPTILSLDKVEPQSTGKHSARPTKAILSLTQHPGAQRAAGPHGPSPRTVGPQHRGFQPGPRSRLALGLPSEASPERRSKRRTPRLGPMTPGPAPELRYALLL